MEKGKKLICYKCKVELKPERTYFNYLGHSFHTDLPRCPKCGMVFVPEELAKGKMAEVEHLLEEK